MLTVIIVILAVLLLWVIFTYNGLIKNRNQTDESWSDIDVQLKRRHDLIPNLVASVQGYDKHESTIMTDVTNLRTQAMQANSIADKAKAEVALNAGLTKLFAVAENYPDLKASANFLDLQKQLGDTEEQIQLARRYYNACARAYNTKTQSFPNVLLAKQLGFKSREFFIIDTADKANVNVNFN